MPKGPVSFQLEQAVGDRPVILLFAPSERSPAYESQIPLLDDATLRELHPLLVRVFTDGDSYAGDERIDDASIDALRTSYDVDDDEFLILFIDLDGTELHRSDAPVPSSLIIERFSGGVRGEPRVI